jgi:acetyltransferase-like isoleucine patch superfamily enzyme
MTENIFFDVKKLKKFGKNSIIGKTVRIRHPEKVSIGDNVIIDDFVYIAGEVEIGDYVHIAPFCLLSAGKSKIIIKDFSGVASGCKIYAVTSNYIEACIGLPTLPEKYKYGSIFKEVVLEKHVFIGANCVILPGCHIPEGMATAAGLIVRSKKYEPWSLLLNSSGKILKRKGVESYLNNIKKIVED